MPKIMDSILPILSILGYWAIILGTFKGPGISTTITTSVDQAHLGCSQNYDRETTSAAGLSNAPLYVAHHEDHRAGQEFCSKHI